jgi:YD repeat-containing protein
VEQRTVDATYTVRGELKDFTDPRNAAWKTTIGYDSVGRVQAVTNALADAQTFGYDAAGRLTAWVEELGRETRLGYNSRGWVTSVTEAFGRPLARTTYAGYDAGGNLTSLVDPLGRTATLGYDRMQRPTTLDVTGGSHVDAAYGPLGELLSTTVLVASGLPAVRRRTEFQYDALYRLNKTSVAATVGGAANYTNEYLNDELGRTKQLKQSGLTVSPKLVTFTYNNLDQFDVITRYNNLTGMGSTLDETEAA